MPRDLARSDKNVLRLIDNLTGDEVVFYYRTPTAEDVFGYQTNIVKKQGKKFKANPASRIRYALKIITGIRDGDFLYAGEPVSSDPESPNYREDWKKIIEEGSPDLLNFFSMKIFEGIKSATDEEPEVEQEGAEETPANP